ncbi:tyrosine-type recombinase/integrase [Paenibacillus psychroresistens]|nr:phage integrase N-terminal domain-containing protein [Paenibacillus psychroresistens]
MPIGGICPFLKIKKVIIKFIGAENMNNHNDNEKGKHAIEQQMEKIFKHAKTNSYGTQDRYMHSCIQFTAFCVDHFKLQNLRNISDKHLIAFIKHRQEDGISPKSLKNDLSAIRYMNYHTPKVRQQISDNNGLKLKGLDLEKTNPKNGDRAWTNQEYSNFKNFAEKLGKDVVSDTLILSRTIGVRVTEAVACSRPQAINALKTGIYSVKGEAKNGKHREVSLSKEAREVFERKLKESNQYRLFIKDGEKTHEVVNKVQNFINYYRDRFTTLEGKKIRVDTRDPSKSHELTYHGLRYAYVKDRVTHFINKGLSLEEAYKLVTKEIGHERKEVIEIYLQQLISEI